VLSRYSELFRSLLLVSDLSLVAASWMAAYYVRFHGSLETPRGVPGFRPYAELLVVILPLWLLFFRARGLYRPWRSQSLPREIGAVIAANAMGVIALIAISFFLRSYFYSRGVLLFFFSFSTVSVIGSRMLLRGGLRTARRRGYNLRHVLVVGAGELAGRAIERMHAHPETGLRVAGVLTDDPAARSRELCGVPVIGSYGELKQVLAERQPDLLVVALPAAESHQLEKILTDVDDEVVNVRVVPDLPGIMTLRSQVEDLDGIPLISLREGPLVGWAAVQKRAFDVVVSGFALAVASPLIALIALSVRVTSGGAVFFQQERMGLDGRVFRMIKFRSMEQGAEDTSGPVWTVFNDARRTRFGAFLRRTSLDELPQLWNVLRGDMSLVGPRPERPVFIEQFRREIPGYMLRHKIKAGLTGWAQVHGWRGNTSLHERVEHDLYYIQHWSLGLDVRILLMTLWHGLGQKNAY
jgi:Undecaprenyl-phosphate glucose phosphotransferase